MDVLVLGNGFDLAHLLPTTYLCFLKVTEYITATKQFEGLTLGKIFAETKGQCKHIKDSYDAYKSVYDTIIIDAEKATEINQNCRKNHWWNYFVKTYKNDVGWIDFEKEIASVLSKINSMIENHSNPNRSFNLQRSDTLIAAYFPFFVEKTDKGAATIYNNGLYISDCSYRYKSDYIIERDDQRNDDIDKRKIGESLFKSLEDFSQILALYFDAFVEQTIDKLKEAGIIPVNEEYGKYDDVITYNYLSSFERIYNKTEAAHIHGSLGKTIILGINPDNNDNANGDLSFVDFKKYYQRVVFETDLDYLNILLRMREQQRQHQTVTLSIVGHSIDVTDKDSLQELFEAANDIRIYYHKKQILPEYVQKLIRFFGKDKFDELRYERHLRFKPLEELEGPTNYYEVVPLA